MCSRDVHRGDERPLPPPISQVVQLSTPEFFVGLAVAVAGVASRQSPIEGQSEVALLFVRVPYEGVRWRVSYVRQSALRQCSMASS